MSVRVYEVPEATYKPGKGPLKGDHVMMSAKKPFKNPKPGQARLLEGMKDNIIPDALQANQWGFFYKKQIEQNELVARPGTPRQISRRVDVLEIAWQWPLDPPGVH